MLIFASVASVTIKTTIFALVTLKIIMFALVFLKNGKVGMAKKY